MHRLVGVASASAEWSFAQSGLFEQNEHTAAHVRSGYGECLIVGG